MPTEDPDSKSRPHQDVIPGWRPATVARLLRGQPRTAAEALDELDRTEYVKAIELLTMRKAISLYAEKIVACLFSHANRKTGVCNPSLDTIAGQSGCSQSTVQRILAVMRATGLIDWDTEKAASQGKGKPPKNKSNTYTFMKIDLGRAADFVAATLIGPALEKMAAARRAARMQFALKRAADTAKPNLFLDRHELSQTRQEAGLAALIELRRDLAQPAPGRALAPARTVHHHNEADLLRLDAILTAATLRGKIA